MKEKRRREKEKKRRREGKIWYLISEVGHEVHFGKVVMKSRPLRPVSLMANVLVEVVASYRINFALLMMSSLDQTP